MGVAHAEEEGLIIPASNNELIVCLAISNFCGDNFRTLAEHGATSPVLIL